LNPPTELKLINTERNKQKLTESAKILDTDPLDAVNASPLEIIDYGDLKPSATVSEGSLIFKEHLERLSEILLILLVGGMLFVDSWSWRAVGFALFLFVVARPISVLLSTMGSGATWRMRGLTAWFGVRGIGSLYYLMYAIQHGLSEPLAVQLIQLTLVVITLSIVMHGISVKPLLNIFWRPKRQ